MVKEYAFVVDVIVVMMSHNMKEITLSIQGFNVIINTRIMVTECLYVRVQLLFLLQFYFTFNSSFVFFFLSPKT